MLTVGFPKRGVDGHSFARGQQSPNLRAFTYAAIAELGDLQHDRYDHRPEHSERVTRTALGDPAEGRGRP